MSEEFADICIVGMCLSEKDGSIAHLTQLAKKSEIPVHIIHDAQVSSTHQIKKELAEFEGRADLGLIIGFPHKIPVSSINQCRQGVINLHFAPLPAYRGSGTLTHAIIDQATTYGITFHYVDESLDTGDIIHVVEFPLDESCSAYALQLQTEQVAFEAFKEHIEYFLAGQVSSTPQAELIRRKKITPKFCTRKSVQELYKLSLEWPPEKLLKYVRALHLGPGKPLPYVEIKGQKMFLKLEE
jgi:methionyl-tRNA formyltransferase